MESHNHGAGCAVRLATVAPREALLPEALFLWSGKVHYNRWVRRFFRSICQTLAVISLTLLSPSFVPAQQAPAASGARILLLPHRLVTGERATLAVLDVAGRLTPGVKVVFSNGDAFTTDATGRALFVAPLNPGKIYATIEGRSGRVTSTILASTMFLRLQKRSRRRHTSRPSATDSNSWVTASVEMRREPCNHRGSAGAGAGLVASRADGSAANRHGPRPSGGEGELWAEIRGPFYGHICQLGVTSKWRVCGTGRTSDIDRAGGRHARESWVGGAEPGTRCGRANRGRHSENSIYRWRGECWEVRVSR